MRLYRLEPTIESVGDEDWSASIHKPLVYVEAGSDKEAYCKYTKARENAGFGKRATNAIVASQPSE
ncbi:hypothetical protein [Thalassospira profundimaris]|jgi:hypothetical protein|uniref:hypothetical protein n=1 Tax=Thalassospira profundimaris TaxID=502049 RepID=UPI000287351D|nr:hypothetical protein [Thalassospira profundimaris]EKF10352.1 hypothetical protein TH2_03260 [Thalassospira profundimaris WP0211]